MSEFLQLNVVEIGEEALFMFEESMMILFNDTVPADLKGISVIHDNRNITEEIKAGDEMVIGNESFKILFVGDKANETLQELGHATINFNGETSSELPGTICTEKKAIPEITGNSVISFHRR
ncbi:PTS glucitol/sorbitol transporter subunit IIA [Ornithinibacillus bavariensis]|uniref:PTS sorbitol transporter subunit IIA n=1 Tax=Ornithinibacillus bavariensis TaxID=545502 RepID=A0A920C5K9_9BACI|nr:PTS glucitol/sorbitol transporter subunit IIA [Ornithinibacillus bavariensis]GIO26936.1 PTS sorbitol transporter subunit IIA [Ornithinibacillus bavariensis]